MKHSTLLVAAVAVVLAAPLSAQETRTTAIAPAPQLTLRGTSLVPPTTAPQPASRTRVPSAEHSGPTMAASVAGVRTQSQDAETPAPVAVERVGRNPALMIVGGAALVVGAIIGGDAGTIVMVGGAVVGLIGLWNFLR